MPNVTITWDAAATKNLSVQPMTRRSADTLPEYGAAATILTPNGSQTFLIDPFNSVIVEETDRVAPMVVDTGLNSPV